MTTSTRRIAMAAGAVVAFHACPAVAKDKARFVFTALAPPGSIAVFLTGVYQDRAIGSYQTSTANQGFVWTAGSYTSVPAVEAFAAANDSGVAVGNTAGSTTSYTTYDVTTGATNTVDFGPPGGSGFFIGGINSSGTIAATQYTMKLTRKDQEKTLCRPFEQEADGSYAWLGTSGANALFPVGLTDDGIVVLNKECGFNYHANYFLYKSKNGKQKEFRIPDGTLPLIGFVNGSGFGGIFLNADRTQQIGFTSTGKDLKLSTYAPLAGDTSVTVEAIGPRGEVAGYTVDASDYCHGFIFTNNAYHQIDYPNYKNTVITGFSSTGAIVGYFDNDQGSLPNQPFIATCASDKGCTK